MLTIIKPSEVLDEDRIVAAVGVRDYGRFSTCFDYRVYDDGSGRVYGYYESLGLLGVVRAFTWENAYECVEDTIQDDADPTEINDVPDEHGEYPDLPEGVSHRPNGASVDLPWAQTGYAQQDLNGNQLNLLPDEDRDDRKYYLIVEREDATL